MKHLMLSVLFAAVSFGASARITWYEYNLFRDGKPWIPVMGEVHINAHGGCWLKEGTRTYWYGEHKVEGTLGNTAQVGVHVYSSKNLRDWKDEGIALAVTEEGDIERGCVLERPKVLKCDKTGKYVMLFHLERKGLAYNDARVGFAVADSPTGPFKFVKSLRPNALVWPQNGNAADETPEAVERSRLEEATIKGNGPNSGGKDKLIYPAHFAEGQQCRDMTLFKDDDGRVYHIFASERNSTIHIAELTDDYLDYTGRWWRACEKDWTEAPCVWKHGEWYFMLGSGCTGWKPNEARYYRAKSVTGPWERMGDPCVGTTNTWGGQSAFVSGDIAVFDVWCPTNAIAGTYLFKKITYPADGEISIDTDGQAEIDSLAANGGGSLVIPPGEHFTGALFFKPGVKLHLEKGANTHQVYTNITVEGVTGKWGDEHHVSHYYGAMDRVPDECRAKAWWFFGQTETTREGITADAEAFKRAGFGGVVYYDQYHGENPTADTLWSDKWWNGIEFAAAEADRLGLSFETAVGNGYVAGGPWVDPAHGMKRLECVDCDTHGGKVSLSLPVKKKRGWQKTVAVLAIPLNGRVGEFLDLEYAGHEKGLASTMQHPSGMYGYKAKTFKPVTNSLNKIRYWQAKTGLVVDFIEKYDDANADVPSVLPASEIIDETDKFNEEDEHITCELPEGRWKILRLVCVPTGARTKHGRPDAMGLECDKMSREAVRLHWQNYTLPIIRRLHSRNLPIKGIIMDSHEAGAQNWTDDFPEEFKARRGYDMRPFLPVMAGYAVNSQEQSERFLADVRQTCVELISERYYGEFNRLCEAEGLTFTAQTGGGMFMLGDSVFTKKYVQIPESEFWAYQANGAYDVKDCSSAAHLYGKTISSSEALTDTPYRMKLDELRRRCDLAFAFGANAMTVCAVPHMPLADAGVKAKTGPREYGINRTNPWWDSSRPFWDYIAFCSWMLRQGRPAPEALWYAGDKVPNKIIADDVPSALEGLDWDFATGDAVKRLVKSPDAWTTPEGVRYPYVVDSNGRTLAGAPPSRRLTLPHISRLLPSGEKLTFIANNTSDAVTLEENCSLVIDPWTRREIRSERSFSIKPGESIFIIRKGNNNED